MVVPSLAEILRKIIVTTSIGENMATPTRHLRRRWPWILLALCLLLLTALGGAYRYGPEYLRGLAAEKLTLLLQRQVTVGKIVCKPLELSLAIEEVAIREADGQGRFFGFSRFFLAADPSSLWERALAIKSCRLEQPYLHLVRRPGGDFNFSDLLAPGKGGRADALDGKEAVPPLFRLANIELVDGAIEFDDQPRKMVHKLAKLNLAIPFISNFPSAVGQDVQAELSAVVNGTALAAKGTGKPFAPTLDSRLELELGECNLLDYLPYLHLPPGLIFRSGKLAGRAVLSHARQGRQKPFLQLSGGLTLADFVLADGKGREFFSFAQLAVELAPSEVLAGKIDLTRLVLSAPVLALERMPAGTIYPLTVALPETKSEPEAAAARTPWRLTVGEMAIEAATLHFADLTTKPVYKNTISPLALRVEHYSSEPGAEMAYRFRFAGDGGEEGRSEGRLIREPLAVSGQLALSGVDLVRYAPYYREFLSGKVDSGRLRLEGSFAHGAESTLSAVTVELADLALRDKNGNELLRLPFCKLSGGQGALGGKRFAAEEVRLREGKMVVTRAKDGHLNCNDFLKASPPQAPQAGKKKPPTRSAPAEPSWQGKIAKTTWENFSVKVEDRQPATAATTEITGLTIKTGPVGSDAKKPISWSLNANLNRTGKIEIKGDLTPEPLRAKLELGVADLALRPFVPYLAERFNLTLNGGELSAQGGLDLIARAGKPPLLRFRGGAALDRLRLMDGEGEELISLGRLGVEKIELASDPFQLGVAEIAIRDFWAKVTISPEKKLNLATLVKERPESGEGAGAKALGEAEAAVVTVRKVQLANGRIEFNDRSLSPGFTSNMSEMAGFIDGLDTRATADPARVELQGKHDGSAPLTLTGTISPRPDNFQAQIQLALTGMDLTTVTPYTAKYLGRTTDKGKLSLDLRYLIDRKQLTSENRALLDQFTLGRTVESAEATKLPIGLALALLTNRKGEIHLDLPVSGSLDDPEFSLARTIWKMVFNLIAKAVTSPFALLGSLIPHGSPDLQLVSFSPGGDELGAAEEEKLATMVKVLEDRTGLKVDLIGYAAPETDGQFLAAPGAESGPAKSGRGGEKSLPAPELAKQPREPRVVAEELQNLARRRANRVRDYLLQRGQIDPERVFLVEPKIAPEEEKDKPGARVEIAIK